ncbi:MAG: sigma-70 family RNA polymerase sigma factor, partial [Taibaiella sp.]|nr:sigma-70 family RNA polymerase sigma factor [Taibaiella sp.]
RIGMAVLNNEQDVEDAMQTAYINAYMNLEKFQNRAAFATWLTKIMLNQCLEQKRKKQLTQLSEYPSKAEIMNVPANELANKELGKILEHSIAALPEKYRLVFVLREIENLSVRETSETLNIEETNVKVRLNRAKTMLRENLGGYVKDHVYGFHLSRCDVMVNKVLGQLGLA